MGKKLLLVVVTLIVAIGVGWASYSALKGCFGPVVSGLGQNSLSYWTWVAVGFFVPIIIIAGRRLLRRS